MDYRKWLQNILSVLIIAFTSVVQSEKIVFKNKIQENFANSLSNFRIITPELSLVSGKAYKRPATWNEIKTELPEKIYVTTKLVNGKEVVLEVHQKNDLISNHFSFEDVYDVNNENTVERKKQNTHLQHCFYSGYVHKDPDSSVTLSICEGLHGYIKFEDEIFLIEPMKQINATFFHLIYGTEAERNSTHNPLRQKRAGCQTSHGIKKATHQTQDKNRAESLKKYAFDQPNTRGWSHHTLRRKSFIPQQFPVATVEVFVVADSSMIEFHGSDSIEDYVLTMMNMVSDMYKKPSLGVIINVVVSKLLILDSKSTNKMASDKNGGKTLGGFCEWQFLQSLRKKSFHENFDTALMLTRKGICLQSGSPCRTIGLAYIGGMCSANRRCAIVEDIGLSTAYTIAHELGHLLGMTHDSTDNSCGKESSGQPHMMAPGWPTSNHIPMKWSKCSARKLQAFLSSYKSSCIQNKPTAFNIQYQHRQKFPGELYDADTQCRQQYGQFAKHCKIFKRTGYASDMCKQLWCEVEEEKYCVSKLDPAAKGTQCAFGMWCMHGKCINNTQIPHAVHGGWSDWTEWTECTRPCDVGITTRERSCDHPAPRNGGRRCPGEQKVYKTCNTQLCPPPKSDFRTYQCARKNNGTHKYIPTHSLREPCALHCRPMGFRSRSIRMEHKVIDGTPCFQGSTDICINGQCQQLGCDLKLSSNLKNDVCGVCGGKGETCKLFEGKFTQPLGEGYVNAVDIPKGARNILVQEVKPCPSFLALVSGPGPYHINANFTIKLPGKYDMNGTTVFYKRRGTQEFFSLKGPITSTMHFKVLFQGINLGVKYRYVMPINNTARTQLEHTQTDGEYGWMQGSWETCSVHCGGGIMRREKPYCLRLNNTFIKVVNDSKCRYAKAPHVEERACNEFSCQTVWFATEWSTCSQTCGAGRKKRTITCKRMESNGKWVVRPPTDCSLSTKPISIATCIERSCYLSWKISPWGQCHAKCGQQGYQYRFVKCPMKDACLKSNKPSSNKVCQAPKCSHQWTVQPWTQCSKKCNGGSQWRRVVCRRKGSFKLDPGKCDPATKPINFQECNRETCQSLLKKRLDKLRKRKPINDRKKKIKLFNNLKSVLRISAPILNRGNCTRNKLLYFSCKMKVVVYRVAGRGKYCETKRAKTECCKYCRELENQKRRR